MQKVLALATSLVTATTLSTASAQFYSTNGLELGLTTGYAAGLSGEIFVHKPNVIGPIGVKVSASYTSPSDSINDEVDIGVGSGVKLGTFGSWKAKGASESGSHTTLGLDGTYSLGEVAPGLNATAYAGGRYGKFSATESYDATNSTTYSMNSFGIGAGAMLSYALAGNISLVADLGLDQYFNSSITASGAANDTYATSDAGYGDLRSRFAFPGTVVKVKVGAKVTF